MERIIPAVLLLADTVCDIRHKEIYPAATITGAAFGVLSGLLFRNAGVTETVVSLIPGLLLMAVSIASRGQAGAGDALVLLMTGAWTGTSVWRIFAAGLFGAAVFAGVLWIIKRRNAEFPFVPFLLAGFTADTILIIIAG